MSEAPENLPDCPATDLIEATATVVAVDGDLAIVETRRTNACSGCGAAAGCGTSALGQVFGKKRNLLYIRNSFDAVPGEQVIIAMPEKDLLLAALAAYMMPLLAMIGLALLTLSLGGSDMMAGLVSLAGLAIGLVVAGRLTAKSPARFTPVFLRRTPFTGAARNCGK